MPFLDPIDEEEIPEEGEGVDLNDRFGADVDKSFQRGHSIDDDSEVANILDS